MKKKNTDKSFSNLPPELVEKTDITPIPSCGSTWPSHIVYPFNSLRNVYNFRRVVLDRSAVTKLLLQIYVSQDILPKLKKNWEVQGNMQRIIQNVVSFSGLVNGLKKILNIERWNKA